MKRTHALHTILTGLALRVAVCATTAAQAGEKSARLVSFDDALGLAAQAPQVRAALRSAEAKRAYNERIAGITMNPSVGVQPGYRLLKRGDREPEVFFDVIQPWNLAGHGRARRQSASLEEQILAAEARQVALVHRLGVAHAWIELWGAEQVLVAAQREEAVAAELEARVSKAHKLGELIRAELADAKAFHAEVRALATSARGETNERGSLLARQIGAPAPAPLVTTGGLPDPPLPSVSNQLAWLERVAEVPAVVVVELATRAQRAREIEEKAALGTVLSLGLAGERDAPGGFVLSAIARLSFPLFDRGERERGGMAAEAERLQGEREQALIEARHELAFSIRNVGLTGELLAELRDDLVPAASEGAEARRKLFEAGSATILEVLQSDRVAIAAISRLHRAAAAHAWAKVRLWLLLSAMALPGEEGP